MEKYSAECIEMYDNIVRLIESEQEGGIVLAYQLGRHNPIFVDNLNAILHLQTVDGMDDFGRWDKKGCPADWLDTVRDITPCINLRGYNMTKLVEHGYSTLDLRIIPTDVSSQCTIAFEANDPFIEVKPPMRVHTVYLDHLRDTQINKIMKAIVDVEFMLIKGDASGIDLSHLPCDIHFKAQYAGRNPTINEVISLHGTKFNLSSAILFDGYNAIMCKEYVIRHFAKLGFDESYLDDKISGYRSTQFFLNLSTIPRKEA